jgi:ubiquitin-conjugating enzyme E2 W
MESIVGVRLRPATPKKAKKKTVKVSQRSSSTKKKTTQPTITPKPSARKEVPKESTGIPKKKTSSTKGGSSSSANAWVTKEMKTSSPNYRIQRELKAFLADPPPNLRVKVSGKNIRVWIVTVEGAKNTIYEGETFKLRIAFPAQYPQVPPSVYFLPPNIPVHEHVYTNGDICLSLLGKDWRPTMTAQSIAMSILSILSSARSKSLPMDNARHAQNRPGQYQKDWVYHDDK